MGEVVQARTSPTLHPHPSHCTSIVVTSTLRVKYWWYHALQWTLNESFTVTYNAFQNTCFQWQPETIAINFYYTSVNLRNDWLLRLLLIIIYNWHTLCIITLHVDLLLRTCVKNVFFRNLGITRADYPPKEERDIDNWHSLAIRYRLLMCMSLISVLHLKRSLLVTFWKWQCCSLSIFYAHNRSSKWRLGWYVHKFCFHFQ